MLKQANEGRWWVSFLGKKIEPAVERPKTSELTVEQVREAVSRCNRFEGTSYMETAKELIQTEGITELIREKYEHYDVVEIGPGNNPFITHFPSKSYRAVDPFGLPNPELRIENADGLSFLRSLPSKSSVIVTFWVFDSSILCGQRLNPGERVIYERNVEELSKGNDSDFAENIRWTNTRYMFELAHEIRRVSHPEAIVFGSEAEGYFWNPDVPLGHGCWWIYRWE